MNSPIYEPGEDSYLMQKYVEIYSKKCDLVLDMGTGSGIQGITAAKYANRVVSLDINKEAVKQAKLAAEIEKTKNIEFFESDLFSIFDSNSIKENKVKEPKRNHLKFDLIIFNPPYLPEEKELKENQDIALFSGKRGIDTTLRFLESASEYLNENGTILLIGSSLAKQFHVIEKINECLFDHKILEKEHIFFEDIILYEIKKSDLLKKLEKKRIQHARTFAKGKRGRIIKGKIRNEKDSSTNSNNYLDIAIKIKHEKSEAMNTIQNEANFLSKLNKENIGPTLLNYDSVKEDNYLMYKFVEGIFLPEFLEQKNKKEIIDILKKVFNQCYKLDKLGINKFEMHRPLKHVIVEEDKYEISKEIVEQSNKNKTKSEKKDNKTKIYSPVLIDFERARFTEKPKNVTQFCDYIIGDDVVKIFDGKRIKVNRNKLLEKAKGYKETYSEINYKEILKLISNS